MGRADSRSRSRGGGGGEDLKAWGTEGTIVGLQQSGFGFIRPSTGKVDDKDLHFHCTACSRDSPFDQLQRDDKVSYEVELDDRRNQPTATKVQIISSGGGGG